MLLAHKSQIRGVVKFLFQPAEEGFGTPLLLLSSRATPPSPDRLCAALCVTISYAIAGAAAMIQDGVLSDGKFGPKVDEIFGLHLWNYMNVGQVGLKTGPLMAASDRFVITIKGKGGHGAVPQGTCDCIVAGSNLVLQLHSIVSRNINRTCVGLLLFEGVIVSLILKLLPLQRLQPSIRLW